MKTTTTLLFLTLIAVASSRAADHASWRLGEDDAGAAADSAAATATVDAVGAKNLTLSGGGTYRPDVPSGGSTLSMEFTGSGNYTGAGGGYYTGVDLNDFQLSFDAKPTSAPSFHIAVCLGRYGPNQCAFIYYTAGTWHYHINGSGDKITGAGTTGAWQKITLTRQAGTVSLFINGSLAGTSTSFVSPTDDFTIAAGKKGDASVEGRFVGFIDNVKMSTIPVPDTDNDGLPDSWEDANGLDKTIATGTDGPDGDPDSDTFTNLAEFTGGSLPKNPLSTPNDTDAESLADVWERDQWGNLNQTGSGDPDGDFSANEMEETADTDPRSNFSWPDRDADNLGDGWELHYFRANPEESEAAILAKWDGDGDPDSDTFSNLVEHEAGTDPTSDASTPDSDSDGLTDAWEVMYFRASPAETVPEIVAKYDELDDPDTDASNNGREFAWGTDPSSAASSPPAKLTNQHLWKLGEHDPGAATDGALKEVTRDVSDAHLNRTGTNGTYSSVVPSGGSTLSGSFTGTEIFGTKGKGFFTGFDPDNYSFGFDARPTASTSFHIAATIGSNRDADGGGQNLFVYHSGGTWQVHSNGNGNFNSGLPATVNAWQNVRLERANGVNTLYVDNVASAAFTTLPLGYPTSFRDAVSIGGNRNNSAAGFEGGFIGQNDNVSLTTPPLPPADADADGLLDKWETAHGLSIVSPAGNDGPDGDPDGDGASNLHEFAFGGDPQAASDRGPSLSTVVDLSGERYFASTFAARSGVAFGGSGPLSGSRDGVDYEVTGSGDLTTFVLGLTEVTPAVAAGLPAAPAGYSYYTIRLTDPVSAAGTGFIRAKAAPTPAPAP
jgi:hypothetical protein